jgi:hypothetical protein
MEKAGGAELPEKEQNELQKLKEDIIENTRYKRGSSDKVFTETLTKINNFVMKGDELDGLRGYIVGYFYHKGKIAINIRKLSSMMGKCKSSINGSFKNLGYSSIQIGANSENGLFEKIPQLKANSNELRQWSFRQKLCLTEPEVPVNNLEGAGVEYFERFSDDGSNNNEMFDLDNFKGEDYNNNELLDDYGFDFNL